jgi:hypothetical protein
MEEDSPNRAALSALSKTQKKPCLVRLGLVLNPPLKPEPSTLQNCRPGLFLKGDVPRMYLKNPHPLELDAISINPNTAVCSFI